MYFVLIGWLIFRITNLEDLWYSVRAFVFIDGNLNIGSLGLGMGSPIIAILALVLFVGLHAFSFFVIRWAELLDRMPGWTLAIIYFLLGVAFFLGWPTEEAQFIYFQF
jgi:hypothetical protein